jgi:type IV pilus assembly protein PilW
MSPHPEATRAKRFAARAQRGASIIELMVGIVVSMAVGIAAVASAVTFTASQRQGISAGGMVMNASAALSAIKTDVAGAGLGFFNLASFMCPKLNLSWQNTVHFNNADFVPVLITSGGGSSDQLDVWAGTDISAGAPVLVKIDTDTSAAVALQSLLPVTANQAVLIAPAAATDPCVVRTATAVTAATGPTPLTLTLDNTGVHNQGSFTTTPTYAGSSGATAAKVSLLGSLQWSRYRVSAGELILERPLDGTSAVLARNVVSMRVQYGLSASAGSNTLAGWQDATGTPLAAADLDRVRALRVGLVIRSTQREKPDAAGNCEATATMPFLFGTAATPDVADWRCYRHSVAEAVVPLRNIVLGL